MANQYEKSQKLRVKILPTLLSTQARWTNAHLKNDRSESANIPIMGIPLSLASPIPRLDLHRLQDLSYNAFSRIFELR